MPETSALIGYTGFVGGNICAQRPFTHLYNSRNIGDIDHHAFGLAVCAGVRAEMWIANQDPAADRARIQRLMDSLKTVSAKRFVLISTIAVYAVPVGVDEDSALDTSHATAYGRNRRELEVFCGERFEDCLIVRLPSLFGAGIKKNVIFDFLYNNNVDRIDSRGVYQFYDLKQVWPDIATALGAGLRLVNFATAPATVAEIASESFGMTFRNVIPEAPYASYDMRTKYADLFGGTGGYLAAKPEVLERIKAFVASQRDPR